jgi:hypothetical protein
MNPRWTGKPGDCPDENKHTTMPAGYVDRAEDADRRMALGQTQHQCPTCGLWAIWRTASGRRARDSA